MHSNFRQQASKVDERIVHSVVNTPPPLSPTPPLLMLPARSSAFRTDRPHHVCSCAHDIHNESRIKQGDLQDPDYFDFISFAQYASVAEAMRNGRYFFEEKVGAEGDKRTVQRDADFKDNARLPEEHARRVGDRILVSERGRAKKRGWERAYTPWLDR